MYVTLTGEFFYLSPQKKRLFGCSKARQKVVSAIMAELTQGKTWEYTKKTPEQILFMCRHAAVHKTRWRYDISGSGLGRVYVHNYRTFSRLLPDWSSHRSNLQCVAYLT